MGKSMKKCGKTKKQKSKTKLGFVTSMINLYLIGVTWEHHAKRDEESQIAKINSYEFGFVISQFLWESELK